MFLAVALASLTSLGLGANDVLLKAISQETRNVVAQILQQPNGKLYISSGGNGNSSERSNNNSSNKPKKNIVSTKALLEQSTRELGLQSTQQYIELLRTPGRQGGLYGGGPELVVLSNLLRRPIAIYEPATTDTDTADDDTEDGRATTTTSTTSSPSSYFPIECKGTFGDGLFEDPCYEIGPQSAILQASSVGGLQFQGAYSWKLHILVIETGNVVTFDDGSIRPEKHACVLLPQQPSQQQQQQQQQ